MKRLQFSRLITILWAGLIFWLAAVNAQAHDPFDNSARMTVAAEQVEVVVTLGLDGGRQLLAAGGLSAAEVTAIERAHRPNATTILSPLLAERFLTIKLGDEKLTAKSVVALSEGMEVLFTLTYPRPVSGTLAVRVNYYDDIPKMNQGSFVATDEQANELGAAILSRASVIVSARLPEISGPVGGLAAVAPVPDALSAAVPAPALRPTFGQFFQLGIEHILTGYDHLLFLCGLLVVCRRVGPMLAIITCFTLAHSVTLALAAGQVVQISSRIVEPLIAASIVVIGIENLFGRVALKTRCAVTLGFGLIHGFGFAGALRETGLAGSGWSLLSPLLGFNLGVECGQLAVMAVFLPLLLALRRIKNFDQFGVPALSGLVVLMGGFWLIQTLAFP